MKINEIIRRDVLRGAAAATAGVAGAGNAAPYKDKKTLSPDEQKFFEKEKVKLQSRVNLIYKKLIQVFTKNHVDRLKNLKVTVTYEPGFASASTHYFLGFKTHESVELDVTVYYDLPDDSIACTLGHEIAHLLLNHSNSRSPNSTIPPHQKEHDADKLGMEIAQRAGYDIRHAFRGLWDAGPSSSAHTGGKTHPGLIQRLNLLRQSGFKQAGGYFHPI